MSNAKPIAKSATPTTVTTIRACQALCRLMEQWCEQGASNIKVRINTTNEEPDGVWIYGRVGNAWKKQPEGLEGSGFATELSRELNRLAASPHTDECQIRRKTFRDRTEFDLKFHHDKIVAHQGKQLGSYLFGILFRERHEAPNALRQGLRRGRRPQVARV